MINLTGVLVTVIFSAVTLYAGSRSWEVIALAFGLAALLVGCETAGFR